MRRQRINIYVSILMVLFFTSAGFSQEWYEGGNLHRASVEEWNNASYTNRLATSADWFLAISKSYNPSFYKKMKLLKNSDYMNALKKFSIQFERTITEIASIKNDGRVAFKSDTKVAEVAAICYVTMYLNK